MTAMAAEPDLDLLEPLALDEVLWQAWLALELPEGYHAEIIEGSIEVSPTGRLSHARAANTLRRLLDKHLAGSGMAAFQDLNVLHGRKVCIPDVVIGPEDLEEIRDPEGWGVDATRVSLVAEVVSPDGRHGSVISCASTAPTPRLKIPVYVVIDERDGSGHVTVHTQPNPESGVYEASARVPYGTDVTVPEGPAKGFVIDATITGEPREA